MPNFDGGHYFLTVFIPVRDGAIVDADGAVTSHVHALREELAVLPTAQQSPASERVGFSSPFDRNLRTHLARLVVIDDVAYNGRYPINALATAIGTKLGKPGPAIAQPIDQLPQPYLLFACDFDANSGLPAELSSYLHSLWNTMGDEWRAVLAHCHTRENIDSAEAFERLIVACQVETTMPFNDYWPNSPPLPGLNMAQAVGPAAAGLALLILGVFGGGCVVRLIGLVVIVAGIVWAYACVMRGGAKPLPAAPDADLRSVLKALYLQQRFIRFAIDMQGVDPDSLHTAFGAFLAIHQPDNALAPTQAPGVVRS